MQLTDQHIEQLYKFTRQHFVEHYDVQTELVDHLANDIEQIWEENPTLTFEQARDKSFKKFGVFGFMNVVEEKQKQLGKKYRKVLWKYVKEWFRLPKIILTVSIFLFYYYCLQFNLGIYLLGASVICLAIVDLYKITRLKKEFNKRLKENGKKWLLEDFIYNVASFGGIIVTSNIPNFLTNTVREIPSAPLALFIAAVITITIIYSYVTIVVIPKKSEELLEEYYPEYKLAS